MTLPTSTTEPNRLREESETSSLERALLGAGSSYKGSPEMRGKVLAGLGLATSATLLGGSAAASVSSAAKVTGTWTKLLVGVSLVGATAVPVGYYALHRGAPASPARAVVSGAASAEETTAALPEAAAQGPAAAARATLTEELSALDHARLALAGGDPRRALDELDTYDRRYPGGRLQLEAEVLRIDALARVGRKEVARQHAEAFLKRHPNSVLATRVRAHVAD